MNTTYLITSVFLTVILMILLQSIRRRLIPGGEHWRVSHVLVGMTALYVLMDCLWLMEYLSEDRFSPGLFTALNLLFYLTYITLPAAWFLFSMHFLKRTGGRRRFLTACMLPWLLNLALIALTLAGSGLLWTLADSAVPAERYTRGPLFSLFSDLCLFYYFMPVFMTVYDMVRRTIRRSAAG